MLISSTKYSVSACYVLRSASHMLVRHAGLAGRSNLRCKLAQLVAHHVLRHRHLEVILSIVNFEVEPDEVGQDGRGAGLRTDGRDFVTGFLGPDNGETARSVRDLGRESFRFSRFLRDDVWT